AGATISERSRSCRTRRAPRPASRATMSTFTRSTGTRSSPPSPVTPSRPTWPGTSWPSGWQGPGRPPRNHPDAGRPGRRRERCPLAAAAVGCAVGSMKSRFRCTGARRPAGALALAAAAVAPAVLLGAAAPHAAPPQNVVAVGAILDLSDGWTSLGRASRVTLQLATADANAALARSGSPLRVRLQIADAKGEPAIALRQLRKL